MHLFIRASRIPSLPHPLICPFPDSSPSVLHTSETQNFVFDKSELLILFMCLANIYPKSTTMSPH